MAWLLLLIAGVLEIVWATGLKYSEGFTKFWPSLGTLVAMIASLFFLALAVRTIPLGTGYAVWTGIGAIGTVVLGVYLFAEPLSTARVFCLLLIVAGILGLKLTGT